MSKKRKRLDKDQLNLFDYDAKIEEYVALKEEILNQEDEKPTVKHYSWEEDSIALAASLKAEADDSGMSREDIVDLVNSYYGWPSVEEYEELKKQKKTRRIKHLSFHMFNHFLSKPSEYPIPGFYLIAIQRVTKSLKVCDFLAGESGAQVISGDEKRALTLGKLDETIREMQRLKRELRGKRR